MPRPHPRAETVSCVASATGRSALLAALLLAVLLGTTVRPVAATDHPADICFETASGALEDAEWAAMRELVASATAARPALFPRAELQQHGSRLDVTSGHAHLDGGAGAACLEAGHEWSARYDRGFLQAGAERLLAEAPTTPGIASSVIIEWHPAEARLRTLLEFSGPFDIPNGRCWIDEVLVVDETRGHVLAQAERGLATSPFAESACTRFYDHLPEGGAGQQAISLLPTEITPADGPAVRLVAETVSVLGDAVLVSGHIQRAE